MAQVQHAMERRQAVRPKQGLQGLLQQKHLSEMQIKVNAQAEDARMRVIKERVRCDPRFSS